MAKIKQERRSYKGKNLTSYSQSNKRQNQVNRKSNQSFKTFWHKGKKKRVPRALWRKNRKTIKPRPLKKSKKLWVESKAWKSSKSKPSPWTSPLIKKNSMFYKMAIAHVRCTPNNTIINISWYDGRTITCLSTGMLGFKNKWKAGIFAAKKTATRSAVYAWKRGIRIIEIRIRGVRYKKRPIIQALNYGGLFIYSIKDVTSLPHNGCRKKKKKR